MRQINLGESIYSEDEEDLEKMHPKVFAKENKWCKVEWTGDYAWMTPPSNMMLTEAWEMLEAAGFTVERFKVTRSGRIKLLTNHP